jgi:hypothetical protein
MLDRQLSNGIVRLHLAAVLMRFTRPRGARELRSDLILAALPRALAALPYALIAIGAAILIAAYRGAA